MSTWTDLEAARPDIASAGAGLFEQPSVALLATVDAAGAPRIAPICPIVDRGELYAIVARSTPKARDLAAGRRYALHALLGENDAEFQVRGTPALVRAEDERARVQAAARFNFDPADPIFRLSVDWALSCRWENVGRPDMKAVKTVWPTPPA